MTTQHNYKLLIAYKGTHYGGWQIQPNAITIQEKLQEALRILLKQDIPLIGSGRTDAGVHAHGQVAHFRTDIAIDHHKCLMGINALLPPDIRVQKIDTVPLNFHAQHSAISKIYHYYLHLNPITSPFHYPYCWHLYGKFNLQLLKEAIPFFLGTHDFTSFANEAHSGSAARNPIRTLYRLDLHTEEDGLRLEFEADGFLYKMVRNITGTLVDIAYGRIEKGALPEIFAAKDRRLAGQSAPPHGLFLMQVNYPSDL